MAKSRGLELGDVFGQQRKKRKIRAITPFKVIQGHRGRQESKALTIILSRTVSEISQLIVQILDTLRF